MNDLNRSIKIFIDGSDATAGVKKIEDSISQLENKIASLDKTEKGYAKKSKELQKELENKYKTLNTYKQKVEETNRILKNLSGATYDELLAVSQKVRKELRAAVPGTEKYNAALEQNRRVSEAVARAQRDMRIEVGCQASPNGKAVELFNKYAAVVTTVIAAVTGLTLKLNQLREKRNEREDAKADVEALTGLSKESIDWLEQEAKRLSTTVTEEGIRIRQSATEILDAYKLVGSAKPELLSNKEALAAVTEQTLILASASGMTLKDAVDAVTLSLNQYGDGADQAARYANVMAAGSKYGSAAVESVTAAIQKSGVAASSANIPIEQLVGTIETLAEKGIKDEIAGTGLKKFFLTLQTGADDTNPKIVGLETALDNLQKKQLSAAQIKKLFGEEGYNVASVLINETEKVKYYTEAVTGTSVAMEQAVTKSDTAAAKLAQAKNKMNEMGMELMEKLNPSIISVVNGTVNWTRKLITLIDFIVRHKTTIAGLVIGYSAYFVVCKSAILWNNRIVLSFKAVGKAIKSNPWGLVISIASTAIAALIEWKQKNDELSQSLTGMGKVNRDTSESFVEQEGKIRALNATINDNGKSLDIRRSALNELKKIIPGYNAMITDEGTITNNNTSAIKEYLIQLEKEIKLKAAREELEELYKKKAKLEKDEKDQSDTYWNIAQQNSLQGYDRNKLTSKVSRFFGTEKEDNAHQALEKTRKELADVNQQAEELFDFIGSNTIVGKVTESTDEEAKAAAQAAKDAALKAAAQAAQQAAEQAEKEAAKKSKEELQKELEKEKTLYAQKQAFLKEMYLEGGDDTLQTEKQLNEAMECEQMEHLQRSLKIAGEKSKEGIEFQNQINDLKLKQKRTHTEELINQEKEDYERQQNELKELYASGQDENLNTEAAYNEALEQLSILHLERMLSIAGLNAEQQKQIEQQLLDFKVKCMKEEQASHAKAKEAEQKKTEAQTKKEQQQYQERLQTYKQYGSELGTSIGNVLSGQENAMQGFADTMIDIIFDVVGKLIDAEIVKIAASGTSAVARSTAEAMAMPDSVATFGASGAARAAILSGLIMAAVATAKSTLKGLLGGKRSSGSSDSNPDSPSSDSPKRATVSVSQWASGRYDVIGEEDGKNYRDIPYIGSAPTGIVKRTSLVSENGAELIINATDLVRLQKHINYPLVISAIEDARNGHVPQRAKGNYTAIDDSPFTNIGNNSNSNSTSDVELLITEIGVLINALKHLKAYVTLRDIHDAEELDDKSKKPFTRSTK